MKIKAKKSLGQNFLKSKLFLHKICEAGNLKEADTILEIGPGKGALTEKLLEKTKKVVAIEKDHDLIKILKEKFATEIRNKNLILIEGDILKYLIDDDQLLKDYKVVANIPYNITGAIFKKLLSIKNQPKEIVLLVQKEVAQRIVANDNKESVLSLSVKAYGKPKYIAKVSKNNFSPVPSVDSAIILVSNISRKNFRNKKQEKIFFEIIKNGFAHKRKLLLKNFLNSKLKSSLFEINKNIDEKFIRDIFQNLKIDPLARAEEVGIEKWIEISLILSEKN